MNTVDVMKSMQESVHAAIGIASHLQRLQRRLQSQFPLSGEVISGFNDGQNEQILALLLLFEQLQDLLAKRLFRGVLLLDNEDPSALSARNLARRLEKLSVIESSETWDELVRVRNILAHEYPLSPDAQASRANLAYDNTTALIAVLNHLITYIKTERLLP